MRSVRSKDTSPELVVRKLLHAMGYRYRLNNPKLPGKPDIVFAGQPKVIFVHGCFWHGHACKAGNKKPKTNSEYWDHKLRRNRERDAEVQGQLGLAGWQVLVIWECEIRDQVLLESKLLEFLNGAREQDL